MKAYELLAKPEKWTTGVYAKDAAGRECCYNSTAAVCWCLVGAVRNVYGEGTYACQAALAKIGAKVGQIPLWNDHEATHQDVVDLLVKLDI